MSMNLDMRLYGDLLGNIKTRIRQAQIKATLSANAEMIQLYWDIGQMVFEKQGREGWGTGVIPRLARDLHNELPEIKGLSERNIKSMTQFFRAYPDVFAIGQQAVAQLPSSLIAEYALRDVHKPIGVADYELTRALPDNLKSCLPSIEEIEAELQSELDEDAGGRR